MGFLTQFTDVLTRLAPRLPLTFNLVAVPPDRVDTPYDLSPFVPGKDYLRLWLTEVQHHTQSESQDDRYIFLSRAEFQYGSETAAIPAFIGPSSFGMASTTPRHPINRALTPLFPYRGGPLSLTCALQRFKGSAEIGDSRLLEQLTTMMSATRFSLLLDLSDIIWQRLQGLMTSCELHLALFHILGQGRLAPGYFVAIRSSQGVFTDGVIAPASLCVVNDSLRVAGPGGFPVDTQPLPGDVEYILLRIERLSQRPDWSSLVELEDGWRQLQDASRQGDALLLHDALKRMTSEVLRSRDLTDPDKKTMIEKVRERVKTAAPPEEEQPLAVDLKEEQRREEQRQRAAEQAAAAAPFVGETSEMVMVVEYKPDAPLRIDLDGFRVRVGDTNLKLNISNHARRADEAFSHDWRFKAKTQGEELLEALEKDPKVWDVYTEATQVLSDKHIHMRFRGELDLIRVPFEFLPSKRGRGPLVLQHPLARTVMGDGIPFPKRTGLSKRFFNDLYRRGESLSILLIASNTPPEVPRVGHEIQALAAALPDLFESRRISVQRTTLPPEDATYSEALTKLNRRDYHILHYCGHGVFDDETPEDSYLPFRESSDGGVGHLKVPTLKWALEESNVKLVYLSCCVGATQAELIKLQDDDFLGITDGLLQAGVPSVLAYRWPVSDDGGERLARTFYQYLAEEGETDSALLLARRELFQDHQDRSWISPVLILQA